MYSYRSVSVQGDTEIGKVAVQGRDGTNMVRNHPDAADAYTWSLILERGEHREHEQETCSFDKGMTRRVFPAVQMLMGSIVDRCRSVLPARPG